MSNNTEIRQELFTHFEGCVKKHFDFLDDMSYGIDKNTMGWIISYVSDKVIVNVSYGRISFEIDLVISLKKSNISLYIEEIIKGSDKRKFLSATNETTVENAVTELKVLITHYGKPFLNGDINAFENVLKTREEPVKNYDLKLIEEKAVKAWKKGNYDEVVALYQSIKEYLTPIQEKRLSLSLKKINE